MRRRQRAGPLPLKAGADGGRLCRLRAELGILVFVSNAPHPYAPGPYAPKDIDLLVWKSPPPAPDDFCHTASKRSAAENNRAFSRRGEVRIIGIPNATKPPRSTILRCLRSVLVAVVKKGRSLRIVDLEMSAVDTLFYSKAVRGGTVRRIRWAQGSPYVTVGTKLISNEGNVWAS